MTHKKTNSVRCFAAILFIACASLTYALTPTNPGDLNADFAVNILDIQIISGCLGQSASSCQSGRADPNNDNNTNYPHEFSFPWLVRQTVGSRIQRQNVHALTRNFTHSDKRFKVH